MAERLIRLPEMRARVALGCSTIYEMISHGEFPKPIPLGAKAVGWLDSDIDAWIKGQAAKGREKHTRNNGKA